MTSERPARQHPPRSGLVIAILPALALAVLTFVATRPLGSHAPGASQAAPSGTAPVGIAIGDRAPDFVRDDGQPALMGLDHQSVRLSDFAGHPLWIVFWATWCTPCHEEAPDIEAVSRAHPDSGLSVLAIDVKDPESSVRTFMTQHGIDYTVALDSTATVQYRFGGWALPVHFFLDGDGIIRDRYIGQLSRDGMEAHVTSILGVGASVPHR